MSNAVPAPAAGSKTRLGLYGGSFDPIHCGHLLVAQAACEELGLSRLFFIPAAQSPFKPQNALAPASERLRLLRLALAGHTQYEIDDQEIRRGGTSFTIETVRDFAHRFPHAELLYLIGADHVPTLPAWREAESLARMVEFVVIPRPASAPRHCPGLFAGGNWRASRWGFPLRRFAAASKRA